MTRFAVDTVKSVISEEMNTLSSVFRSAPGTAAFSKDELTRLDSGTVLTEIKQKGPVTWELLESACITARQREVNTHKDPTQVWSTVSNKMFAILC